MRSCGCCYAFASATMFSLNYCLAAEAKGISVSSNVLAVQGLVSCGSVLYSSTYTSYTYTYACDGAYAQIAMEYLIDVGLAWSSCVPYASGGSGDYSSHFDAVDEGLPDCARLRREPLPRPEPPQRLCTRLHCGARAPLLGSRSARKQTQRSCSPLVSCRPDDVQRQRRDAHQNDGSWALRELLWRDRHGERDAGAGCAVLSNGRIRGLL